MDDCALRNPPLKRILGSILLVVILTLLGSVTMQPAEGAPPNLLESAPASTQGSGMPGWPVPAQPIPHHDPGQPARSGNATHQVTRLNTLGEEEVVELRGLDALLEDGAMTDPLQGNYRLARLDRFMFGSYDRGPDPNNYSVASFELAATDMLGEVAGSEIDLGNLRFTEIAAGDLNGDYVDEQIVVSAHPNVTMRIGELPGSFGKSTSAPGVIAHLDGSLDVVVRGYDQALWHRHYDGATWGDWDNDAGGLLRSAPAVASRASGELDVFAVGTDNQVYHTHWLSPTWSAWQLIPGGAVFSDTVRSVAQPDAAAPAVVARGGAQLDLFRLGPDNRLWWCHSGDGSTWGAWEDLGGMLASGPGAVSLGDGRMQVYALGLDGALWTRTYDGGWGGWARLDIPDGVAGNAVPALTSPDTGQVTVYLAGTENRIWSRQYEEAAWGSWTSTQLGDRSTSGHVGQGLQLDGIDDYVDLPDSFPDEDAFTFAAWVYWSGGDPYQRIFDFGQDTMRYMDLRASGYAGNPVFTITTGGASAHQALIAPDPLTLDAWVHVAVTLDGNDGVLYIDGVPVASSESFTLTPRDVVGQNTWLGRSQYANDPAFNGKLDEVAIFNRALNDTEIAAIYSGGWDDADADLQMGLHLEETPAIHGTALVDDSGQGHDGWLHTQESLAGLGAADGPDGTHLLAQMSNGSLQYSLNASRWLCLEGLSVRQTFDTGAVTKGFYEEYLENPLFDITTGHFTGDGRQQVVLAYDDADDNLRLEVYDIEDGFALTKTAELAQPIAGKWPRVAAGDVNGDGVDEIGFAFVPDDYHSYQVQVYEIDKHPSGNWTGDLTQSFDSGPVPMNNWIFAGTLQIAAGDIAQEASASDTPNDEFVVISDWRYDESGHRELLVRVSVYDDGEDLNELVADKWLEAEGGADFLDDERTGVGLAVGNVAATDGSGGEGVDEIIVTWPRGFHASIYPRLYRDLVVFSYKGKDNSVEERGRYAGLSFSRHTFLDNLAVGDLDLDLMDEIVMAVIEDDGLYHLDVYEFETLSEGPRGRYQLFFDSVPRAFNLAMGDFTGDSLRVGPPTYRLQNRVDSLVAVINMPPKHRDYVKVDDGGGGSHYELVEVLTEPCLPTASDPRCTHAKHAISFTEASETKTQNQRDWAIGAGYKRKVSVWGAFTDLSLDYTYGQNFEKTEEAIESSSFTKWASAYTNDKIVYFGTPYKVWEYPLFAPGTQEPVDYVSVVFPVPEDVGGTPTTRAADTTTGDYIAPPWYRAGHQTYNVWSYDDVDPDGAVGFPDYDPDRVILDSTHAGGGWGFAFSDGLMTVLMTTTAKTHDFSAEMGWGYKGGFSVGSIGFKANVRAHVKGSYKHGDIETEKQTTTSKTDISGYVKDHPPNAQFDTRLIGYWANGGYLVLDYQTNMPEAGAWKDYYSDPDPAFILPWSGFPYGTQPVTPTTGLELFSPEVQVVPGSASVGEMVTISATVRNFSNEVAPAFKVRFCQGDPGPSCQPPGGAAYIGEASISGLSRENGPRTVSIDWHASGTGKQRIYAVIDPDNTIDPEVHDEDDLINNNIAYGLIKIGGAAIVDQGLASELPYQGFSYDQGAAWTVAAYVPPGNLSEVVDFELQDAGLSVSNAVGRPFELVAYAGEAFRQAPPYGFPLKPAATDPPAVIGLAQSGTDVAGLKLYRATDTSGSSWEEATCSGYQIQRFPDENLIYVPIDQTGIFVFAETLPRSASAPVAQFSASPTSGPAPLSVAFTDQSSNFPTDWLWDFGDGTTSTEQHPMHLYNASDTYTVALTVSNAAGSHTLTVDGYITVRAKIYLPLVLRDPP